MNCADVLDQMTAFMDGELPAAITERIKAHLDSCVNCAQVEKEHQALYHLADRWTVEGSDVWEATRRQIEEEDLLDLRRELQKLRAEMRALQAEVSMLRIQVAEQKERQGPSPMLPYAPASLSTRILV